MSADPSSARAVRVLEVLPRSAGGIGRHVADVVAALDGREELAIDVAGPPTIAAAMPKPLVPLDIPAGPRGHRATILRLRALLRRGRYDVVHAHGLRAGIDASLARRRLGLPCILTVHNLVRDEIAGRGRAALLRRAEALAVRLADLVLAPSEQIATHLRTSVPSAAGRIEVLHLPPATPVVRRPAEAVRAELGVSDGQRLVVTVTRLAPQKALHVMLDALAELPGSVVLAVVGEGGQEGELRRRAALLGLSERVRWLGWRADAGDLIAAADAFCLSSVWEAVSLAAQEAVQLGTPVVSTDVGGMRELVRDRVSGRLVPGGDRAALARALEEVVATPAGKAYARRAARDYAESFSRERTLARLAAAYLSLGGATPEEAG